MKQHILLLAFITASTIVIAQVKPSFGIRGGLSSSGMRGDAVNNLKNMLDFTNGMINTTNRTGFFAGAYTNISLGNNVSVEPALYYTQKGYEMRGDFSIKGAEILGANAKAGLNSHYIDLPVLLKVNVAGLEVFAGPQVSYLAKADLRTTAGILGFNVLNKNLDATRQFNRWDAGVTGGIGYRFNNGVNVMAAYDHGLIRADANQNFNTYNRSFKIGLGYSF